MITFADENATKNTKIMETTIHKTQLEILDMTVNSVDAVSQRCILIKLTHDKPLNEGIAPGQFVQVRIDGVPSVFLRRPISICMVDYVNNELWLLVACVGDGTRHLAQLKRGDRLNCVLPLGNKFYWDFLFDKKVLLIGGGVGVAPLLYMGEELRLPGVEATFLLGARTKDDLLLLDEFRKRGRVLVTTEDGSCGERGFVTDHSVLKQEKFDRILSCGPTPMMKAVVRYARAHDIDCQVSLENLMACGLGACLCCVEKVKTPNKPFSPLGGPSGWWDDPEQYDVHNLRICKDGPVFDTRVLLWG